jgi:HAD superfamily hydrolase (TIGR01509 family)
VVFDLDGVLVDSEGLHIEAWKILFARHGICVSDEEYAHGIGMADIDWIRYLFGRRGQSVDPVWWQDAKRVIYRDILARNVRPFPGVVELARRLHPEFRLAVASNSWREDIETVLRALGIRACFDALTGKEDVERHKPDPEAYLRTAAALGVEPAACMVIEDSPLGIRAAKAAGMRCVGVANTLPADQLVLADLVLPSLEDSQPILRFARGL